jgi:hypothetical protein
MYGQPVENQPGSPLAAATPDQPSQRSLRWARVVELDAAIVEGDDSARIVEEARELVDVLLGTVRVAVRTPQ